MTADVEPKLVIGLSSGIELIANRVMLFPEADIREILSLRAKAQEALGGFSTGLGFWGSPSWAIGGAAILGFAESLISNSKTKEGLKVLQEVAVKVEHLKRKGLYFDIAMIEGIYWARPGEWRAIQVQQYESARPSSESIGTYAAKFVRAVVNDTDMQTKRETALVTDRIGFIYDDNDFINFEVRGEPVAVRWSTIERYQLVRTAETVPPKLNKADSAVSISPPHTELSNLDQQNSVAGNNETHGFGRRGS
jgi:hypothetical protein